TSSMVWTFVNLELSSQEYNSVAKATITTTWKRYDAIPRVAVAPTAPRKNTAAVLISPYRASKPRIDGVTILLKVTVWNATVANECAAATTAMTRTVVMRDWAIFQNPALSNGIGLS